MMHHVLVVKDLRNIVQVNDVQPVSIVRLANVAQTGAVADVEGLGALGYCRF